MKKGTSLGAPESKQLHHGAPKQQFSSRNIPGPLYRRNTDGKCPRSQGGIHRWLEDRFGPPVGQRVVDVLEIEGHSWACVSLRGGFSRSGVGLAPQVSREAFQPAEQLVLAALIGEVAA